MVFSLRNWKLSSILYWISTANLSIHLYIGETCSKIAFEIILQTKVKACRVYTNLVSSNSKAKYICLWRWNLVADTALYCLKSTFAWKKKIGVSSIWIRLASSLFSCTFALWAESELEKTIHRSEIYFFPTYFRKMSTHVNTFRVSNIFAVQSNIWTHKRWVVSDYCAVKNS